jgi:hypothetical protein
MRLRTLRSHALTRRPGHLFTRVPAKLERTVPVRQPACGKYSSLPLTRLCCRRSAQPALPFCVEACCLWFSCLLLVLLGSDLRPAVRVRVFVLSHDESFVIQCVRASRAVRVCVRRSVRVRTHTHKYTHACNRERARCPWFARSCSRVLVHHKTRRHTHTRVRVCVCVCVCVCAPHTHAHAAHAQHTTRTHAPRARTLLPLWSSRRVCSPFMPAAILADASSSLRPFRFALTNLRQMRPR